MEKVWHHTLYNELRVSPEEHPVMMTECASNPRENRERLTQIMFEVFSVPKLHLSMAAVCALYATGRTTGVVLDSGDGVSHTVPIYEGFAIPHSIQKMLLAGNDLTTYLQTLLKERGLNFNTPAEMDIVRDIKETMCYVVGDFEAALKDAKDSNACDKNYELPDGKQIMIGSERFRCAEAMFRPDVLGKSFEGVHTNCFESITRSHTEASVRRDLFSNIILTGGSTLFEGMSERMQHEMNKLATGVNSKAKVLAPPERLYSVWLGGSILASLSTF
jgi:actin-related protein